MLNMFLKARNSKRKGFTIIEMVVVIAIIGILSSILIPNFSGVLSKASSTAEAVNLASVNKIAASAKIVASNGQMLDVCGAVVTNFGKETASASMKDAVYDSETHTFTAIKKAKVKDKTAPERNLYYPVYGESDSEIAKCLKSYDFVTYFDAKNELSKSISKKIGYAEMKDLTGKFTEVYVVNGSIALQSDLELTNAFFIFLDGASLETNGNAFKCNSIAFVDTSADGKTPVTFNVYGGNLLPEYSYGVLNVSNFYKDDGSINADATATFAPTTKITMHLGGTMFLNCPDYTSMYLNVDSACHIVEGIIGIPVGGVVTLDGESKMVVENGGAILPAQTQGNDMGEQTTKVYVTVKAEDGSSTEIQLKPGALASVTVAGENSVEIDGEQFSGGSTKFTISPPTIGNIQSTITQMAHATAAAGGNTDVMLGIVERVGNAIVDTAKAVNSTLGQSVGTTAYAVSQADLTSIVGMVNTMKTDVVTTAIASASNSAGKAISTAVGTVTLNTVGATPGAVKTSVVSNIQSYNSCDTTWYTSNPDADSYTITTPAQLYGLSTLVFNGVTSFYGKTITLNGENGEFDLDNYRPWLPIGNGQYGFRGTLDGNNNTIKNMHLDVNKSWIMLSMSGKGWNNTALRCGSDRQNTAFGYQNGDKYSVGFIGVLENGGKLKDLTFTDCNVKFDYNWNSYAAVAVGAIRATGENYSYNGSGYKNAGKVITNDCSSGAKAVYLDSGATGYASKGYKYNGDTFAVQNENRLSSEKNAGYTETQEKLHVPYTKWLTTIENVTVGDGCSVFASGRCGGLCAVLAGAYYTNKDYNDGKIDGAADDYSVFGGWGEVLIKNCTNKASVTHSPNQAAYEEGGGILGYCQVASNVSLTIENCSNAGNIIAGAAAGILGSSNNNIGKLKINSCSNTGKIQTVAVNSSGVKLHSSTVASSIYNTTTSTAGTDSGNVKLS